jgi:hypothetical protein
MKRQTRPCLQQMANHIRSKSKVTGEGTSQPNGPDLVSLLTAVPYEDQCRTWKLGGRSCWGGLQRRSKSPVKQGWTELSPECDVKMSSGFKDVFRGVGTIKYFCSTIYKTSKFIMCKHEKRGFQSHAGCFEWERTGLVTVESTKSWLVQILCVFILYSVHV